MSVSMTPEPRRSRLRVPLQVVQARPRLFISIVCGIVLGLMLPADWRVTTRVLMGWNTGALLYFVLAGMMILTASDESIARRAKTQDEGRFVILILTTLAAAMAIGAIIAQLATVKDLKGVAKDLHVTLAAVTIVSAWALIHLMFALHYAHEYVIERAAGQAKPAKVRGGLVFPGVEAPDYLDFLYFSYVIGVACQTADVEISSRAMRRIALVHGVVAFFFNSAVLALTINIAAGLI